MVIQSHAVSAISIIEVLPSIQTSGKPTPNEVGYLFSETNTPQLATWGPRFSKTRPEGAKLRNTPSACSGDRNFEGFANLSTMHTGVLLTRSIVYFYGGHEF